MGEDFVMDTYRRWPVEFESGRGAILKDIDGNEYLDLVAGIAVASVGHAHPGVAAAVVDQVSRLVHVSNLYRTGPQLRLAESLHELTGMYSFFCNSGAEAVECALKLARRWGGRHKGTSTPRCVAAEGSFHGRTFGALAATGQTPKQEPFAPMLPGFGHVPYGDSAALDKAMGPDVVAVLLEPIQGEAGVIVPPDGYLQTARELCDEWGALLIFDEVQTGLGRTGSWFAYERAGVAPDVLCLAKALAGGLPMGACLANQAVASAFTYGDHASTFGGGPVQSAAALAVLDAIGEEGFLERVDKLGIAARERLASTMGPDVEVRGDGLLIGIDLHRPAARAVAEEAFRRGVLVNDATEDVVRLAPPLVVTEDELDRGLQVIEEVWDAAH